jgi:hypothetical protein
MGHKQPASSLSRDGLLPVAFQPFGDPFFDIADLNVSSHRKRSLAE